MSIFSAFALWLGLFMALVGVVSAWLFRTSSAPLAAKLAVPILIVIVACVAPFRVSALMGLPVPIAFSDLPDRAELVAFVPHDAEHMADLWLLAGGSPPRAYEVALDEQTKQVLKESQERKDKHLRTMLVKRGSGKPTGNDRLSWDVAHEPTGYEIDFQAFPIPQKDGGE